MSAQTYLKYLVRTLQNRANAAEPKDDLRALAGMHHIQDIGKKCFLDTPLILEQQLANEDKFQAEVASFAAGMLNQLVIYWRDRMPEDNGDDESSSSARVARYSSDFAALHLSSYIMLVARQIQVIAWGASFPLLMLIVVLTSYSTQSPLFLARFVAIAFLIAGCFAAWVLGGMERNTVLSQITGTNPGSLGGHYWLQLLSLGVLPLIGVLAHLYPDAATFLSSWVAPSVQSLR
jgi:hypothetical protein